MTKVVPLVALAAASLLAACSHNGARHFSMFSPGPQEAPSNDPPNDPPPHDPDPTPTYDQTGTLTRTSDGATDVAGGALHVAGNVVLGVGEHVGPLGHVGETIDGVGHNLKDNGVGGLPVVGGPLANTVEGVDNHLNGVAQVEIVNLPVAGATTPSGDSAIAISALSQNPATGTVATVGVLNQGSQQQPLNVSVGNTQVLGTPGPAAVNVGVLNGAATPTGATPNPLAPVVGGVTNVIKGVVLPGVSPPPGHP